MKHLLRSSLGAFALGSLFVSLSSAQSSDLADPAVNRVRDYNQQLSGTTGARLRALLGERAVAFSDLVAGDPAKALSVALPAATLDRLRAAAPGVALEERGEWEGVAGMLIADDFEHHRSRTRWRMTIPGNGTVELFFSVSAPQSGTAIRVRGVRIRDRLAVAEILRPEALSSPTCLTTGPQKIAVLMVTTPGNPTFPSGYTATTLQAAFFGSPSDVNNTMSLNGYWKELSYSQTSATGQVFGPFALSSDYSCTSSNDQSDALAAAAIAAADSTVDFTQFNRIAVVFPKTTCSYGGLSSIGCESVNSPSKGSLTMSESWLPTMNYVVPPVSVFTHELGHALGLNHSSTEDYGTLPLGPLNVAGATVEYGDPFSLMGNSYTCPAGNVFHGGHYTAQQKSSILHWLPLTSGYQEILSSGTYTVAPLEQSSGVRGLRVRRDALADAWLWIEYRQKLGDVDSALNCLSTNAFNGALVHYADPTLDGLHTYLLDFNPLSAPNDFSSSPALMPGQSWSDPNSLLTLRVNSADSSGLSVSTQYDSPCASLQASPSSFSSSGGSGAITVNAPAGCSWTASTGATGLLLSGATSGSGNGTVPFTVSANTGRQRRAFITVQRQGVPIVQTGANGLTVVSATPSAGSGLGATFTLVVSAAGGATTLTDTYFAITDGSSASGSSLPQCAVLINPPWAYLLSDTGTVWNPVTLGSGSLSNSQCTLAGTGSSAVKSGNQMTVTLNLSFQPSWAGTHSIIASTTSSSGDSGNIRLGAWTVGTASSLTSTTTTVNSSANPSTYGQNVTLTAIVSPAAATGSVTFRDGLTTLGSVNLSGGAATFLASSLSGGAHSFTASYSGDSSYSGSTSSTLNQTVNTASTVTTTTSSPSPSSLGQSVTFTATVSPSTATGTVTFKDGAATLGTANLSSGLATFSTTSLSAASHSITAVYNGDANYAGSSSVTLTQIVNNSGTSVTLNSSLNPSTFGQSVTFTATVSPSSSTGTVTFKDGAATLGTANLNSGSATFSTTSLSAASHSITAVYNGAPNTGPSTSSVLTQAVNSTGTGVALGSSVNPSPFGQSVTFTATVLPSTATGTVTFKDGVATLGTANLSGGSATYSTAVLATGAHSILAIYNGDTNNAGSTSATVIQVINAPATYSITGQVTLSGSPLGSVTISLSPGASVLTNSSGSFSFSGLAPGVTYTVTPALSGYIFTPASQTFNNLSASQTAIFTAVANSSLTVSGQVTTSSGPLANVTISVNGSQTLSATTDISGNYNVTLAPNGTYILSAARAGYSFSGPITLSNLAAGQTANFTGISMSGLQFIPVTPCRVVDTRAGAGKSGAFGPPTMAAGEQRSFPVPSGSCGIPSNAAAYSLNFTVVPKGYLGFLTTWPAGQAEPVVSTLNSYTGAVVANAAIVPAGTNGAISIHVTDPTDVLFDINGYFAPPPASGNFFYPVTPCRVADTRTGAGKTGLFGPPTPGTNAVRTFPVPSSGCNLPASATAYSMNFTVVPQGYLGYLTTWPTGQSEPVVSTLNSYSGTVVANAAIVPAGSGGAINVHVTDPTDVLFDANGYFGAQTGSGLQFYPVTPCRVADTRSGAGKTGPFGPPAMAAGEQRAFPVPSSTCGIPSTASAYSLNVTVIPKGYLGFLTSWPAGQPEPVVSTLNSYQGQVVANAAIVPAGANGAISIHVTDATDVLFDINGYFAP